MRHLIQEEVWGLGLRRWEGDSQEEEAWGIRCLPAMQIHSFRQLGGLESTSRASWVLVAFNAKYSTCQSGTFRGWPPHPQSLERPVHRSGRAGAAAPHQPPRTATIYEAERAAETAPEPPLPPHIQVFFNREGKRTAVLTNEGNGRTARSQTAAGRPAGRSTCAVKKKAWIA